MTGLELHMYDQLEQARDYLRGDHRHLRHADPREGALQCLSLALGFAKRSGNGYAAGRILTAIQWAKLVKLPVT